MIREAEKKDYKKIYELGEILHDNFQSLYNLEEIRKNDYLHILVSEKDSKITGYLMYTKLDDIIDIIDIIVEEEYRNQKFATRLFDEMITTSKPKDRFYLEVRVDNVAAIKLYEKFGFQTIYTRKKYYGDKDAFVMERVNENE